MNIENSIYTISSEDLTLEDIAQIMDFNLKIQLSSDVNKTIQANRDFLENKIKNNDQLYYGINTGFGSLCNHAVSKDELKKLQLNLVRSHACGASDEIEPILVKIMLLLKVNALSKGFSGVNLATIERLIFLFNNNILPVIYESGSLGASGDLAPLAHMSLALIGEGYVNFNGERLKTKDLYEKLNLAPIELAAKEGLALLNGTQFMSAHGTYAALKMDKVFEWVNKIAALSLDAFNCRLSPFNEQIHKVRPYKGQQGSAKAILETLKNSELISVKDKDVQDPYSFRCIPQVHGASLDVLSNFKDVLAIEINSVTDNPILFESTDEIISAGNFHGQPLALSMDFMAIAVAEIGSISERRTYKLISGTRGLPPFLIKNAGLNSGFMIPQYTSASIVSKNKILAHPASVDSIDSSNGQEDHVSMGSIAGVKLLEVIKNIERIISIELLVASQAFEFRRPRKSSLIIEEMLDQFRKEIPFIEEDEILHDLMERSLLFIQH
jgi:histidine ammonia-lyase